MVTSQTGTIHGGITEKPCAGYTNYSGRVILAGLLLHETLLQGVVSATRIEYFYNFIFTARQ